MFFHTDLQMRQRIAATVGVPEVLQDSGYGESEYGVPYDQYGVWNSQY